MSTAHAQGGSAAPAGIDGGAVVQIEAGSSGRCLAVTSEPKNGAHAYVDFCGTNRPWALWRAIPTDNSSFELRSLNGGRCLEVENSGTHAGAVVQTWDCSGGKQMRWQMDLVDPARKLFQLRPTHTQDRCLDVAGGDITEGKPVQQWYCNYTAAQLWRIKPVK
ncbi:RICIN domain-containing protein [Streptomyces roseifaciens]